MKQVRVAVVLSLFTAAGVAAHAQANPDFSQLKNEVGLEIGATVTPSVGVQTGGSLTFNSGFTLGIDYDHRLFGKRTQVAVGVDFLASPNDVKLSNPPTNVSGQYAFLFLPVNVRVKFNADRAIEPWLEFGGGYANFTPAQPVQSNIRVAGGGSTGTLEFGGGVDTKPLVHFKVPVLGQLPIGARFEVRDFYSGEPNYAVETTNKLQNNIAFTGGLLLRF